MGSIQRIKRVALNCCNFYINLQYWVYFMFSKFIYSKSLHIVCAPFYHFDIEISVIDTCDNACLIFYYQRSFLMGICACQLKRHTFFFHAYTAQSLFAVFILAWELKRICQYKWNRKVLQGMKSSCIYCYLSNLCT